MYVHFCLITGKCNIALKTLSPQVFCPWVLGLMFNYGIPTTKVGKRRVDVREEEIVFLLVAYLMVAI